MMMFLQILAVKIQFAEYVPNATHKITELNVVVLVIILVMLWWNVRERQYCVMDFALAMTADIVFLFVTVTPIVHVAKNASTEVADLFAQLEINVQRDKYAIRMFVFLDVALMHIVEMTWFVPQGVV